MPTPEPPTVRAEPQPEPEEYEAFAWAVQYRPGTPVYLLQGHPTKAEAMKYPPASGARARLVRVVVRSSDLLPFEVRDV